MSVIDDIKSKAAAFTKTLETLLTNISVPTSEEISRIDKGILLEVAAQLRTKKQALTGQISQLESKISELELSLEKAQDLFDSVDDILSQISSLVDVEV